MDKHLFVVCGVTNRLSNNLKQALKKNSPSFADFFIIPTSNENKYTKEFINHLLNQLVVYIKSQTQYPKYLSFIYSPDSTSNNLFETVYLFTNLIECSMSKPHDLQSLTKDIASIVAQDHRLSIKDCLLLPEKNYLNTQNDNLSSYFLEYAKKNIRKEDIDKICYRQDFNNGNFSNFLKGKERKKYYKDKRDLIFPPCKDTEKHGSIHPEEEISSIYYLTSLYRFGFYKGDGFHFDVQFADKNLGTTKFECNKKKRKVDDQKATHANIYLNDYVRL